jgi:hypothetical protein
VASIQPGGNTLGGLSNGVLETFIRDDGSFEFASVPSGIYTLRSIPRAPNTGDQRVEVDGKDIRGLEIGIPFRIDAAGRVLLNGQNFIGDVIVEANQGSFGTAASIRPDGTFRLPLTEGNNRISVGRLPPELKVVSIAWGSTEILNTPLRIDPDTAPREIVINLEKNAGARPGNPQTPERALPQVVGKVSAVDSQGRKHPIMPANLTVAFKRPSGGVGGATIAQDGTFGMPLPEELYMVSVTNVTAPFVVKSISSGGTDLLKQPLEVTSRRAVPPIEIILEYRP